MAFNKPVFSSQKLVSVVIPAYNSENFVERTLASVCAQTYDNLEIIVVNDGSTDTTPHIITTMAQNDPRIRLLTTQNRGVAAARNFGAEKSRGDYIAFVDADDLWHPTKIEKQVRALESLPPNWAAVYTLHWVIDEDDVITKPGGYNFARGYIFARHITMKYVGNGSALLVRRRAVFEAGGFDPSYAAQGIGGCEDIDFELKLAERYLIEVVPERLVGYRKYEGAMSSNYARMAFSLLETIDRALKRNPQLDAYAVESARIAAYRFALIKFIQARAVRPALRMAATLAVVDTGGFARMAGSRIVKKMMALAGLARETPEASGIRFEDAPQGIVSAVSYDEFCTPNRAERLATQDILLGKGLGIGA